MYAEYLIAACIDVNPNVPQDCDFNIGWSDLEIKTKQNSYLSKVLLEFYARLYVWVSFFLKSEHFVIRGDQKVNELLGTVPRSKSVNDAEIGLASSLRGYSNFIPYVNHITTFTFFLSCTCCSDLF